MEKMVMSDFYKGKKVFVTGHTGFKGSWFICLLNKLGAKVCGYSLEPYTNPNMFNLIGGSNFIEHHIGDVRDFDHLYEVMNNFKPDIVFHLAAQPIVLTSYQNPRYTYETNVMGTINVLESIRLMGGVKSFVNITTDKVYLNNDSGIAFKETDNLCGYDPYSNSKSCSELVTYSYLNSFFNVKDYDKHHLSISTCRAGNVIGGGDWSDYRIIPDCIKSIESKEPVIIRNPFSTRPFQHVLEPLYIYAKLAMMQYTDNKYASNYNIGPNVENCISVQNLLDMLIKYEPNISYEIRQNPDAKHEASLLTLDNTKVREVLGYKPVYNMDETIKSITDWTQAYLRKENMFDYTNKQIDNFFNKLDTL